MEITSKSAVSDKGLHSSFCSCSAMSQAFEVGVDFTTEKCTDNVLKARGDIFSTKT